MRIKIKGFLLLIFLTGSIAVQAQSYTISETVDIFGDTVITYKDKNRNNIAVIKYSTDIFGNKVKTVTGPKGENIQSVKKSKDIFGNQIIEIKDSMGQSKTIKTSRDIFGDVIKTIIDQNGRQLLAVKKSKDIFGNWITTINSDEDTESVRLLMNLLQESNGERLSNSYAIGFLINSKLGIQ